jgi:pimeloyl-ACP methyl ester carboxylesterase
MADGTLITHRSAGEDAAIVFIHGFSGDPKKTWGEFPALLSRRRNLRRWDVYSLGFPTSLGFDIVGLWKANPDINAVAGGIKTRLDADGALASYGAIALVAHSMGGLAVQRALVDFPMLVSRVDSVILFGTPSGGLKKASFFKFWKRQLRDMAVDGPFIRDLRARWTATFGASRPFQFLSVAGDQDEFVPQESSLGPFESDECDRVPGDHLSIVKPGGANLLPVDLVERTLTRGVVGSACARRAVERVKARAEVDARLAICDDLDEGGLRDLALALERVGDSATAIKVLQRALLDQYDARGVLAGRLKRRWLIGRRAADGRESLAIYSDAFQRAARSRKNSAAFYNGVNVAFLRLAFCDDLPGAQTVARQVLRHCNASQSDATTQKRWLLATEGEANLYLAKPRLSIAKYAEAIAETDAVWEKDSMYQQATRIASIVNDKQTAAELARLFDRDDSQ